MNKLALREDDLHLIRALLKKWVPQYLVMAYGSRVKGLSHEGSDLDLVIKNPINPEKPTLEIADLKQSFSESNLPILVDVMDWAYLPAAYRDEIDHVNVILQSPV